MLPESVAVLGCTLALSWLLLLRERLPMWHPLSACLIAITTVIFGRGISLLFQWNVIGSTTATANFGFFLPPERESVAAVLFGTALLAAGLTFGAIATGPRGGTLPDWEEARSRVPAPFYCVAKKLAYIAVIIGLPAALLTWRIPLIGSVLEGAAQVRFVSNWLPSGAMMLFLVDPKSNLHRWIFGAVWAWSLIQGANRWIPMMGLVLFLLFLLHRSGLRWPPIWAYAAGFILALAFLNLDGLSYLVAAREGADSATSGGFVPTDVLLLDQAASYYEDINSNNQLGLGRTYLDAAMAPIPSALWPKKPSPARYLRDMTSPARPWSLLGSAPSAFIETYYNFRWSGVVLLPLLIGTALGWFYKSAVTLGPRTLGATIFCFIMAALGFQFMRDGLYAVLVWGTTFMTPAFAVSFVLLLAKDQPREAQA